MTKEKCRHVEPPVLSDAEIREMTEHLEIRHWCPVCDRKIFSRYWMAWTMKQPSMWTK